MNLRCLSLALVSLSLPACSSASGRGSDAAVPDVAADETGPADAVDGRGDLAPPPDERGEVPAEWSLAVNIKSPTACGCKDGVPSPGCGWFAGAAQVIPVKAKVSPDPGGPHHGVDKVELFFLGDGDPVLLDSTSDPPGEDGLFGLALDVEKLPGGRAAFEGKVTLLKLRVAATSLSMQGAVLTDQADFSLKLDLSVPAIAVTEPTAEEGIKTPYIGELPYEFTAGDQGAGLVEVRLEIDGQPFGSIAVQGDGLESTQYSGAADLTPVGTKQGVISFVAVDCVGNQTAASVPVTIVAEPDYGAARKYMCASGVKLARLRAGDLDGDAADVDLVASSSSGVLVWPALGGGKFGTLQQVASGDNVRDAVVAELTGDELPDLAVLLKVKGKTEWSFKLFAQNEDGGFGEAEAQVLGKDPYMLDVVDISDDGILDVLVAHSGDLESIMLLLGTGKKGDAKDEPDTWFEEPKWLTGVGSISHMTHADLNGDGYQDIVVARDEQGIVSSYLNNGDGTFPMARDTLLLGNSVPFLEVADFDGDQTPDVVVFLGTWQVAYEMKGLGDGYFGEVELGGVAFDSFCQKQVSWVMDWYAGGAEVHNRDGAKLLSVGAKSDSVAVADFDGDGDLDFGMAEAAQGILQLFNGLGDGRFTERPFVGAPPAPGSLLAADLDQDGDPELAVIDTSECSMAVHEIPAPWNESDAASKLLPYEVPMPVNTEPKKGRMQAERLVVADLDLDGGLDLAVATDSIKVWIGDLSFLVRTVTAFSGMEEPWESLEVFKTDLTPGMTAEVTGLEACQLDDGPHPDLALTMKASADGAYQVEGQRCNSHPLNLEVLVGGRHGLPCVGGNKKCGAPPLEEDTPLRFLPLGGISFPGTPTSLAAAPLDEGDARDDLVVGCTRKGAPGADCYVPDAVSVLITAYDAGWKACAEAPMVHFGGVTPGPTYPEWDCEGEADPSPYGSSVTAPKTGEEPVAVAVEDVDGDGTLDLVVANKGSNDLTYIRGVAGPGEYLLDSDEKPLHLISVGSEPLDVALGDVDGDGWVDLAVALKDKVSVSWGMDGTNFETPFYIGDPAGKTKMAPTRVRLTDVNGDGRQDVVILSQSLSMVFIYLTMDDRVLLGPFRFPTVKGPADMQVADMNQDGCRDIVVANKTARTVSILLNGYCVKL